jgi:hypothetical protein
MKTVATFVAALLVSGAVLLAHGGNEHVRGVVTQLSAHAITVQTANKATRTITITEKTAFKRGGKDAQVADLKVGDRVVIDVPAKKSEALLVQIGVPAGKPSAKP